MTFDPETLLRREDILSARTPAQLSEWVNLMCRAIADVPEAKVPSLLRHGLFKQFYEEVFPLSRYAVHRYGERTDIRIAPQLGTEDFDAIAFDETTTPPVQTKVEITRAIDGYDEHLRMKYFIEHGSVPIWGPLLATGSKKSGHKIHVEHEAIDHFELVGSTVSLIKNAIERKTWNPERYGMSHVLLVSVDDWGWFDAKDHEPIEDSVESAASSARQERFTAVYLVGMSGRMFIAFGPNA
jgi:hypothetical protein